MSDKEEPLILRTQDARGVVTLALNRPQAFNALSEAMLADLQREFLLRLKAKLFARVTTSRKCGRIHQWSITSGFLLNAPG